MTICWLALSNSGVEHVTRFPASDPSKAENFKTGINNNGLGIDSQGNVWVTNRFGTGPPGMAHLIDMGLHLKLEGIASASPAPGPWQWPRIGPARPY